MKRSLEEIFSLLEDLRSALLLETQLLKRMDRNGLMELLPRKLFLVEQVGKLKHEDFELINLSDKVAEFRKIVSEIRITNETNRIFAEEALCLWSELLSILLPKQYSHDGKTRTDPVPFRGVALKTEA